MAPKLGKILIRFIVISIHVLLCAFRLRLAPLRELSDGFFDQAKALRKIKRALRKRRPISGQWLHETALSFTRIQIQ